MDLKIQRSTANGYNGGQKINDNKIYIKSNEQISNVDIITLAVTIRIIIDIIYHSDCSNFGDQI